MRRVSQFILNTEEKLAIKNVVDTVNCECECQDHEPCPFLMENGGCMLQALEDILDEQERRDF